MLPVRYLGVGIFLLALVLRLLFWRATPDAHWPGSLAYKGDAYVWLEETLALQQGTPANEGLPLRPPGMAWILSWIWSGTAAGVETLRGIWCVLGALGVWAFHLALVKPFGLRVATIAGVLAATSTSLLLLSSSLCNEVPYLILVLLTLALHPRLRLEPRLLELGIWAALHGGACLIRAEHALFFGLCLMHLGWSWRATICARRTLGRGALRLGLPLGVFALVLLPWQLHAWSRIAAFNRGELVSLSPQVESAYRGVEERTAGLRWDEGARRAGEAIPGFIRRPALGFVAATRQHRGETTVREEDLAILREAYGYYPQPIAAHPFVCTYGSLNFYLANNEHSTGGFGRGPLNEPPPLEGGPRRYPRDLIVGIPPPFLSFTYTPHLGAFNEGYSRGWEWIRSAPGEFVNLAGRKLGRFTAGATLGVGGTGWPLGLSGTRRPVDLVVPAGRAWPRWWAMLLLGVAALGGWKARRRPELVPWLLLLLSKVIVTVLFFGYARQGALVAPVLILLVVLAVERIASLPWFVARSTVRKRVAVASWIALALLVGSDGLRCLNGVRRTMDGAVVGNQDPLPPGDHEERWIEFDG